MKSTCHDSPRHRCQVVPNVLRGNDRLLPAVTSSHQVLLLQPLYTWSGSLQQDILIDIHLSRCVFAGSFSTLAVQQKGSTKQWGKTNCCCWRQHERVARKRTIQQTVTQLACRMIPCFTSCCQSLSIIILLWSVCIVYDIQMFWVQSCLIRITNLVGISLSGPAHVRQLWWLPQESSAGNGISVGMTATSARWWKQNRHVWSHYQHTTAGAHVMSSLDPPRVHVPNEQLGVSFSLASLLDLMMFIYHLEIDHEDLGRVHLVNETSL